MTPDQLLDLAKRRLDQNPGDRDLRAVYEQAQTDVEAIKRLKGLDLSEDGRQPRAPLAGEGDPEDATPADLDGHPQRGGRKKRKKKHTSSESDASGEGGEADDDGDLKAVKLASKAGGGPYSMSEAPGRSHSHSHSHQPKRSRLRKLRLAEISIIDLGACSEAEISVFKRDVSKNDTPRSMTTPEFVHDPTGSLGSQLGVRGTGGPADAAPEWQEAIRLEAAYHRLRHTLDRFRRIDFTPSGEAVAESDADTLRRVLSRPDAGLGNGAGIRQAAQEAGPPFSEIEASTRPVLTGPSKRPDPATTEALDNTTGNAHDAAAMGRLRRAAQGLQAAIGGFRAIASQAGWEAPTDALAALDSVVVEAQRVAIGDTLNPAHRLEDRDQRPVAPTVEAILAADGTPADARRLESDLHAAQRRAGRLAPSDLDPDGWAGLKAAASRLQGSIAKSEARSRKRFARREAEAAFDPHVAAAHLRREQDRADRIAEGFDAIRKSEALDAVRAAQPKVQGEDFDKLVQARMARTGETYPEAAKAVARDHPGAYQ